MPVETKVGPPPPMIQSLVAACLPAYVALRCPFYVLLMGTLRCKVLDQHKKIQYDKIKNPQTKSMDIMDNFYSFLKGFRNVGLILWSVVWKADETETEYISQVLDQSQLSFPPPQQDCGNPSPQTSQKLRTTINRRKLGFSPRKKTSTFEKGRKRNFTEGCDTTILGCKCAGKHRAWHVKNENYSDEIKLTAATKKGSMSFVWTTQSCEAFRRRIGFASTTRHIRKASFNLSINDLVKLFPMLPWIPELKWICLVIFFFLIFSNWTWEPVILPSLCMDTTAPGSASTWPSSCVRKGGKAWPLKWNKW